MVPQVLSALEVAKGGAGAQQAGVEIHEEDGVAIRVVEGAHSTSTQSSENFSLARRTAPQQHAAPWAQHAAHSRADSGLWPPKARPL